MSQSAGYDEANPESILQFGVRIRNCTAREICGIANEPTPVERSSASSMKGVLGRVVEQYYGIPRNNSPEPDFPRAKVELKVVPLEIKNDEFGIKEPTSISLINYMTLVDERWDEASVRKKLNSILFVFFEFVEKSPLDSRVKDVVLWHPTVVDNALFEIDWLKTWQMVYDGEAHHLSETIAEVLAPRRKGPGGAKERLRPQPHNLAQPAKARAFALKTRFTNQIFEERVLHRPFESAISPSLLKRVRQHGPAAAAEHCQNILRPLVGRRLDAIARDYGTKLGFAKNIAATIIKDALGIKNRRSRIREFEQWGLEVKTLNLRRIRWNAFRISFFPCV